MDTALLVAATAALTRLALAAPEPVTRARFVMGTVLEVVAYGGDRERVVAAVGEALDEVHRLDAMLSTWKPESEVSRLNREAGGPARAVPPPLAELVRLSLHYAAVTEGAFVPTAHPLILAYGIEPGTRARPGAVAVRRAVALSATTQVELTAGGALRLKEAGAGLNFGAIGKGYALDRAGAVLAVRGLRNARLNFGGQVLALGAPPGTTGWEVVIVAPADPARVAGRLMVSDASVSTSASPGPGHVVDPRTGRPVVSADQVTVIAPTATAADALSTASLVLGPERARAVLARVAGASAVWIHPERR